MDATLHIRVLLAALVLMWFATIAREPGGIQAFASEVDAVEQDLRADAIYLEEAATKVSISRALARLSTICARDPVGDRTSGDDCEAVPMDSGLLD